MDSGGDVPLGSPTVTNVPLVRDVGRGEAVHVRGLGVHRKSLYIALNIAMILKLLLKKKKGH